MTLFYELLQISLSNRKCFSKLPSYNEWIEIFTEADRQSIVGIMFCGIEKVIQYYGGIDKSNISTDLLVTWYSYTQKIKERNQELNRKSAWLQKWLSSQGFSSCILKGQGNALMYPDPLLRMSGDIDVWMWMNKYDDGVLKDKYFGSQNREYIIRWVLNKMKNSETQISGSSYRYGGP